MLFSSCIKVSHSLTHHTHAEVTSCIIVPPGVHPLPPLSALASLALASYHYPTPTAFLLTHSLLTHSLTQSLRHSVTQSLTNSLTHYSLTPSLTSTQLTSPHLTSPKSTSPNSPHLTSLVTLLISHYSFPTTYFPLSLTLTLSAARV